MKAEDIQIRTISITDTFRYGGVTFEGLKDLRQYAEDDSQRGFELPPYVVRKDEKFPCFDSSDFAFEDRYEQAYFLTRDKEKAKAIYEEANGSMCDASEMPIVEQYPVMEPLRNMNHIQECQLPFIYYQGEGDYMDVVEDRNALWQVEILDSPWDLDSFKPDPHVCLYGPPPELDLGPRDIYGYDDSDRIDLDI